MSEMHVLDRTGHTRVQWDSTNDAEVASARAVFNEMTAKGYRAFAVGLDADKPGRRIDTFDPDEEEMVLVPHIAGG